MAGTTQPLTVIAPADLAPPTLVGTMLGDRPSALFRSGDKVASVPMGSKMGSWRVIAVDQGEVTVQRAKQIVRLSVNTGSVALSPIFNTDGSSTVPSSH